MGKKETTSMLPEQQEQQCVQNDRESQSIESTK